MSPRASLPGADELFRRTAAAPTTRPAAPERQDDKSTDLQVAADPSPRSGPKHAEKITFYCTAGDLMSLEQARLKLRAEHGVAADRGRIIRAALAYVLEDFDARGTDSILLRRIQ